MDVRWSLEVAYVSSIGKEYEHLPIQMGKACSLFQQFLDFWGVSWCMMLFDRSEF